MNFFPLRLHPWILCAQIFLLVAALPARLHGQSPAWRLDGPAFSAAPEEIRNAAADVPTEKFIEATVFFERDAYTIDAHGLVVYRHSMIYRIETKQGVEDWAETSRRWEPWYQKRPEIRARVIQPDGKVSQLDQKTITDGPAGEDEDDTYSDARIRKAPLPGLSAGAIVEEETVVEDKTPFFSGGGVYSDFFNRAVPVLRSELIVDAARELKLQYRVHLLPNVAVTDEEQAGARHLKFVQGYMEARVDSDIDLSTHNLMHPMIEFSTGESWAAVAAAYRQLAEPRIDPSQVKSLLPADGALDRMETIRRIVARLHKEVRYTGLEFGEAALQPQTAAEVLKRHYGDCKDKAAMLVAMLRAAGIEADMALVDSGPGLDLTPELPGMNHFDHAIVYLPGDKGGAPLWIDATAEYTQVGELPYMDQGRTALIIAAETQAPTQTPAAQSENDILTELRDVALAGYGPAHIVETSITHGGVDAYYRSEYGGADTRKQKEDLEKYAKNAYLAKALNGVEHGDGKDLTKPFTLKLEMAEAKRGNALLDEAAVAIPFAGIFNRLPNWFTTDPNPNGDKLTPQQEEDHKKAVAARVAAYDVMPLITEWHYTITPPDGFILRALPEDKTVPMGPAVFSQHYHADARGVVNGVLRFELAKSRLTVDDALALRDAVVATYKQDALMVLFDQAGAKLLAEGKIREALAADRALIEQHPAKALYHAQIASAFLQAGMGDRARAEAMQAVKLDPASLAAQKSLAWACQFNAIGIKFSRGFDWECATSAYKKALELDPEDSNTAINLAILDEYGRSGERYAPDAPLADAIRQYQALKEKDKATADDYEDNLLIALLYGGQYKELLQELDKLPSSEKRNALGIAAAVAQTGGAAGVKAGIERADHLSGDTKERSAALVAAGDDLLHLRLYPEAVEILSAGVEGQSNAAGVTQQIALFRQLAPWKRDYLPAADPRSPVQRMFFAIMIGSIDEKMAAELLSRHAYSSALEWRRNLEKIMQGQGILTRSAESSGLPSDVLLDVFAANLKFTVEGGDSTGYKISMQSLGSKPKKFFVSKDDGSYKIVTDGKTYSEAGSELLYLLQSGREAEARSLLDWMRELVHRGGGDDPLSGPLLPRFWSSGDSGGPDSMRLAAASLVAFTPAIKPLLPAIRAEWETATGDRRLDLGLLLANGYIEVEDGPDARTVAAEILKKYPGSYEALELDGGADALLKDWSHRYQTLEERIIKRPDDEILLRQKAYSAEAQGDFVLARAAEQAVIDQGKATANDYNMYAWTALFDGKVDADVVKAAQQSAMLTNNNSFAELHTLACIYAVQGKTGEARELLLKGMAADNMSEPNAAVWFAFGVIYEQYGINDAAIEAYRKVEKPDGPVNPTDTYVLAQARLKALGAAHAN